jgi:hypothetical protein
MRRTAILSLLISASVLLTVSQAVHANRDPLAEQGGMNLYKFVDPINDVDAYGDASLHSGWHQGDKVDCQVWYGGKFGIGILDHIENGQWIVKTWNGWLVPLSQAEKWADEGDERHSQEEWEWFAAATNGDVEAQAFRSSRAAYGKALDAQITASAIRVVSKNENLSPDIAPPDLVAAMEERAAETAVGWEDDTGLRLTQAVGAGAEAWHEAKMNQGRGYKGGPTGKPPNRLAARKPPMAPTKRAAPANPTPVVKSGIAGVPPAPPPAPQTPLARAGQPTLASINAGVPPISAKGLGNVSGGATTADNVLKQAEKYLGPGYRQIDAGVYRSADGTRQFRMTDRDLTDPKQGPHVHFEAVGPDGRTTTENSHVTITP